MLILRELMVQLGLSAAFKHKILHWDDVTITMKEPSSMLGKSDITRCEMREVVI